METHKLATEHNLPPTPQTASSPPVPADPSLSNTPVFTRRELHPNLVTQCQAIFFRQSFLNDYLSCPQMALYRWVLNLDQAPPYMAATLGTAGHEVIYHFHQTRKYDYGYMDIMEKFESAFNKQVDKERTLPQLPKGVDTVTEAFAMRAPEYAKLLLGYQYHPRNHEYHSTLHEQSFVLEIPGRNPNDLPYLFTGQLDQGGYYDDGKFAIRDIKFRDNAFRPSKIELDLNVQLTIYAAAIKYGKPACEKCRPQIVRDEILGSIHVEYHGPCADCKAKIGTPKWPQKFPDLCELIWMNDFDIHNKDQHEEWIIDNTKPKIPNPKGKGPKVFPRKLNPDYNSGYKKGQYVGVGFMQTVRPPSSLGVLMSDILRVCDEIRKATFYRKPGKMCGSFCGHRESCVKGLELEVKEADLASVSAVGTEDPW